MPSHSIFITKNTEEPERFGAAMLSWYDKYRRILPWRTEKNCTPDPYHVWLSEIMLQQTTVPAVIPYFLKFTEQWPNVSALAQASLDEVMQAWAGLGYYARARNLHKCAQIVSEQYDGIFPCSLDLLKTLPGVGEYTSAAITAIAFNQKACVVDGNVERVIARYCCIDTPLPEAKKEIKHYANIYTQALSEKRYGDYAQSLMDLGAAICTPKSPRCGLCPINNRCLSRLAGTMEDYPKRKPKAPRPQRYGYVYWIENKKQQVLVHKRPEKGLLGGLYGLPTSSWENNLSDARPPQILKNAPCTENLTKNLTFITHVFTHFSLTLYVYYNKSALCSGASSEEYTEAGYYWIEKEKLVSLGFPSLFEKVRKIV